MLKRVDKDVYNIVDRLKKIDREYEIFYNYKKNRYEVFVKNEFNFVIDRLDKSAILKAYRTHIRHKRKIFMDIKDKNERLEQKYQNELLLKAKRTLTDYLDFLNSSTKEIDFNNTCSTLWL